MNSYVRPTVICTYSITELCEDAASCQLYTISDRDLKREIELVEKPLERIRSISADE